MRVKGSTIQAMHCIFAFMKNTLGKIAFMISLLAMVSCGKETQEMSMEALQTKADSILAPKYKQMQQEARDNLDKRRSIELKPKVDSLLNRTKEIPPIPILKGHESIPEDSFPVFDTTGQAPTPPDSLK